LARDAARQLRSQCRMPKAARQHKQCLPLIPYPGCRIVVGVAVELQRCDLGHMRWLSVFSLALIVGGLLPGCGGRAHASLSLPPLAPPAAGSGAPMASDDAFGASALTANTEAPGDGGSVTSRDEPLRRGGSWPPGIAWPSGGLRPSCQGAAQQAPRVITCCAITDPTYLPPAAQVGLPFKADKADFLQHFGHRLFRPPRCV
jgi:hypothetical protein